MDRERAAFARLTLDSQASTHGFNDSTSQRKTESGAMNVRASNRRAAVERLKDVLDLLGRDADAAICNGQLDLAYFAVGSRGGRMDSDPLATAAILDGVGDQVLQALRQGAEIGSDRRKS